MWDLVDGLFKANVAVVDKKSVYLYPKLINKEKSSIYLLESPTLWHARLGHVNYKSLKNLSNLGYIPKLNLKEIRKCETCVEAKLAKNSFHSIDRNTEPLGLIHSDLCDLKFMPTRSRKKYFITFIDDYTRYYYVYLLNSKDEVMNMFIAYKAEVENQLYKNIKILKSDRGGEYESNEFSNLCAKFCITHQTTAPYTPQQNEIAKRKNFK